MVKILECHWAVVAERRVLSLSIVEQFDVVEHMLHGAGARKVILAVNPFGFQFAEEALRRRVVVAVAPPAHAANDAVRSVQHLSLIHI